MIYVKRFNLKAAGMVLCATTFFTASADAQTYPGAGGAIPFVGSGGGGTWPSSPPPSSFLRTALVTAPVANVVKLTMTGWVHTWIGDEQVILIDPAGVGHNIMVRPGFTGSGAGSGGDNTGGVYTFVSSGGLLVPTSGDMAAGTYSQHFGVWTSGSSFGAGFVYNDTLNTISGPAGNWTLAICDWAGNNVGALASWSLTVNAGAPNTYCAAKPTSNGCSPTISYTGAASATNLAPFFVRGTSFINHKPCLLLYGTSGQASAPFQGGTLCIHSPIKRTPATNTLGSPALSDCSGIPSIDMNLFAVGGLGGSPLPALTTPGSIVDCQWWGRDPGFAAPNNTMLSNGLNYTVGP